MCARVRFSVCGRYSLEGKAKTAPDTAYVTLLSGTHVAATDSHGQPMKGFGNGSFLIDWDKAQTLPEHGDDVGTALVSYSCMSSTAQVTVDVKFTQVLDAVTRERIDATYGYVSTPGAGRFRFSSYQAPGASVQRFSIESRWQNSGAGRADVIVTGGGLSQPATANECWDRAFRSQYRHTSYDQAHDYGSETVCVFTPAEYSPL